MRKLLISILLASAAATPALADPPKDRDQAREERNQAREDRQQARKESRSDQPQVQRVERAEPQIRVQPQVQARQQTFDRTPRTQSIQRNTNVQTARQRIDARQQAVQDRRDQRIDQRQDRIQAREVRQAARTPVVSNVPRPGTQPPLRVDNRRPSSAPRWSTNWRHNGKYDWNNYRHRHRSLFHLGFYYDPFGWGYQPYQIGWRLWPSYYSNRYWINDPWQYRLPYAPPGYQWVRYWNDAVLVDTWSGEVVDVLYNFFW